MTRKTMETVLKMTLAILIVLAAGVVYAEEGDPLGYALLIQQSPPQGGVVTPGAGVHKISVGQSVPLTAIPNPGYRFLYWLGDVTAMSSSDTSINLDSPKMVIAVFERESFEEELAGAGIGKSQAQGGMGGLIGSPNPVTAPGTVSSGNYVGDQTVVYTYPSTPTTPENDDDTLIPGEPDDENIEEVPEPATVMLLGLGAAALLRKRK